MRLRVLAAQHPRYGYRRLGALLRREGRRVNHKKLERLYRQQGLAVQRCRRKRRRSGTPLRRAGRTRTLQKTAVSAFRGNIFVVYSKSFRMFHHVAIIPEVLSRADDDDLCVRHSRCGCCFGVNKILQTFVRPKTTEEHGSRPILSILTWRGILTKKNVRNDVDAVAWNVDLVHHNLNQMLGVNNDLVSAANRVVVDALWSIMRSAVAEVLPWVVDRNHNRDSRQQR